MICRSCGYTNMQTDELCDNCNGIIHSPEAAANNQRIWGAMSQELKKEFEDKCKHAQERFHRHSVYLKKRVRLDILMGTFSTLIMSVLSGIASNIIVVLLVTASGSAVGYYLNKRKGGRYWGM